jgi:hypothetical protein
MWGALLSRLVWLASMLSACGTDAPEVEVFSRDGAGASCPTAFDLSLLASDSRSDPGWTGAAYGDGPPAGSFVSSRVVECDDECRRCRFEGPVRGPQPIVNQRCIGDLKTVCASDAECQVDGMDFGPCRFMFPPFAGLDAAVCSVITFEPTPDGGPPFSGVADLLTGELDFDVLSIKALIALGTCASCLGDPMHGDGMPEGMCEGDQATCDVAGVLSEPPIFTSYDCAPGDYRNSFELVIPADGASTTPKFWTLDDSRPNCTVSPFQALHCWCGVCEDSALPCFSDAQCGAGSSCGWPGPIPGMPQYRVAPDSCTTPCEWNEETQSGSCLRGDGRRVGCLPRSGTIAVRGGTVLREGYNVTTIGLLTCMPSSGDPTLDTIAGFPGPLYYQASYEVRSR